MDVLSVSVNGTFQCAVIAAKEHRDSRYVVVCRALTADESRQKNLSPPRVISRQSPVHNIALPGDKIHIRFGYCRQFTSKQVREISSPSFEWPKVQSWMELGCLDSRTNRTLAQWMSITYLCSLWAISAPQPFVWNEYWKIKHRLNYFDTRLEANSIWWLKLTEKCYKKGCKKSDLCDWVSK